MLKSTIIDAKTTDEALKKAVEILKVSPDKIKLNVLKETKGFSGFGSNTNYEAVVNVELGLEGKNYLDHITSSLGLEAFIEMKTISENEFAYNINSNQNGLLIGKDGKTLSALQTLVRSYLQSFTPMNLLISIDCGNYNANRKKHLEILATKTAKEVAKTKIEARLDSLNAYERRIVHAKLAEWNDVYTVSEGEGEERSLIIKYKK